MRSYWLAKASDFVRSDTSTGGRVYVSKRVAIGGIALVCVVVAVWLSVSGTLFGPPEHHVDGDGPLASLNGTGTRIGEIVDRNAPGVWTFGYQLCLAQGDQAAIIDSVGPTTTIGTGFKYLGSLMRTFDVQDGVDSAHEAIGSVQGFPPPTKYAPDYLRNAIGYPVSVLCQPDRPSPPVTYTELLVGFSAVGTDGGGWLGIDVGYTVGGHHRVVSLNYDQLICGTSTAARCVNNAPSVGPPGS